MSSKSRTRFFVVANSIPREIFSVRERTNGDLVILHRDGGFHEVPDRGRRAIVEQRTSIHVSPQSRGTTVIYTLETEGQFRARSSAYIRGPKKNLMWLARSVVPANPWQSETHFNPGIKDRLFRLKTYECRFQSLAYAIVLSSKERKFPAFPTVFNLHVAEFNRFNVGVYYAYFTFPAPPNAAHISPFTSKPLLMEGASPERHSDGAEPMTDELLLGLLISFFGRLATRTVTLPGTPIPPDRMQQAFEAAHLFSLNPVRDFEELGRERARGLVSAFPSNDGTDGTFIRGAF